MPGTQTVSSHELPPLLVQDQVNSLKGPMLPPFSQTLTPTRKSQGYIALSSKQRQEKLNRNISQSPLRGSGSMQVLGGSQQRSLPRNASSGAVPVVGTQVPLL